MFYITVFNDFEKIIRSDIMNSSKNKTCFILNYAPHYRKQIFIKLSEELDCDIFCGDTLKLKLKKIDFDKLDFKIKELKTIWFFKRLAWMKGQLSLLFDDKYKSFVLTGQPYFISDTLFILCCFFTSKKVYLWNHSPKNNVSNFKFWYYKILLSLIDGFFLYSNYDKNILINKFKTNTNKLHVIFNSLDYEFHKSIRNEVIDEEFYKNKNFFTNPNLPIVVFIGRLESIKKIERLIEAIISLKERNYLINLLIIGDGSQMEFLKGKASGFNDQIYFYGNSYDEFENGQMLANTDLCVSPGNVGLTAIHALSFGTPVCTHDNFEKQMPEVEAIIEGQTGIFFNYNQDNLVETIINWFNSQPTRSIIRENCYKIIDSYYNPNFQVEVFKKELEKH